MSDKAERVRREITALSRDLFRNQKPTEDKLQMIKECLERKTEYEADLTQLIQSRLEQFSKDLVRQLSAGQQDPEKFATPLNNITQFISCSVENQENLLNLLDISDGVMVARYPEIRTNCRNCLKSQLEASYYGTFLTNFSVNFENIDFILKNAMAQILGQIKKPEIRARGIVKCEEKELRVAQTSYQGVSNEFLVNCADNLYRIEHLDRGDVKIYPCQHPFESGELASCQAVKEFQMDKVITKVCSLGSNIILLLEDQSFQTFDIKSNSLDTHDTFGPCKNPVIPYIINEKVCWAFYDEGKEKSNPLLKKLLKFESAPNFSIPVNEVPSLTDVYVNKDDSSSSILVFVDNLVEILIVDVKYHKFHKILQIDHGLSRIDHVTLIDKDLFIWTIAPNTVTIMRNVEINVWKIAGTYCWKLDSSIISLPNTDFKFLQFSHGNENYSRAENLRSLHTSGERRPIDQIVPITVNSNDT